MDKYNDFILSPESFEKIAKEYYLQTKNSEITINYFDENKKNKILDKINEKYNNLCKIINCLNGLKLNNNYEMILQKINNLFHFETKKTKTTINYCQLLHTAIVYCCDLIEQILMLRQNIEQESYEKYKSLLTSLVAAIPLFSQMYGTCKYRQ